MGSKANLGKSYRLFYKSAEVDLIKRQRLLRPANGFSKNYRFRNTYVICCGIKLPEEGLEIIDFICDNLGLLV